MAIMNDIKGDGHSLVAPRMTVGWGVYAIVAVLFLAIVAGIGLWAYGKVKTLGGLSKVSGGGASLSDQSGMGSGAMGWL